MLTLEAIKEISQAKSIYGSKRAIELAKNHIRSGTPVHIIEDYGMLRNLEEDADIVILSTGDPMLSGLGYLKGRVIPGISSMQIACARLRISQLRMVPITVHGRALTSDSMARISREIKGGNCVFLLTDESTDLDHICDYLESEGLAKEVAVLAELGYSEEKIEIGRTSHPPRAKGLSCVVIGDFSD